MPRDRYIEAANRAILHGDYTLHPYVDVPPRVARALAYQASRRQVLVSQLISELVVAWAEAWEEQLGPTDRRAFYNSFPRPRGRASERAGEG